MKIVLYLPTPGGLTGAPRRLLTLASSLREHGVDVCVAGDANAELLIKAQEGGFETLPIEPVGVLKLRGGALFGGSLIFRLRTGVALLRQNLRFRRLVRKNDIDVVWVRGSKGIAFAALGTALSRRPLFWDVAYELPSGGLVRWLHRLGLWVSRAVVFQYRVAPDAIFGTELADQYRHKFKAIIPGTNLSDLERYRTMRQQIVEGCDSPFVILQVGTLCDRKNQLFTLEVIACLRNKPLPVPVTLRLAGGTGDEGYLQKLQQIAEELKGPVNVEFLGWRTDIHELMTKTDLLVLPSKGEGVPNTVQEAMFIGVPVVSAPAGGIPEIVSHCETGWIEALDDSEVWADRIFWLIRNPDEMRAVAERASSYARRGFGVSVWGRQYAGQIKSVVPGRVKATT